MASTFDIITPDGERHRHVEAWGTGRPVARTLPDGSIQVVSVHEEKEVKAWGGEVVRPGRRWEEVEATYPPGSRIA